ncbi:MAG: hypothetical protein J6C99_07370 [Lachnospiraceae bacterium]|nr:hypothetical protein [Lachnospiraceae bacterium]
MRRKKCSYKLTSAVYSNPCLNRKLVNLGRNLQTIECILGRLQKINACKKLIK